MLIIDKLDIVAYRDFQLADYTVLNTLIMNEFQSALAIAGGDQRVDIRVTCGETDPTYRGFVLSIRGDLNTNFRYFLLLRLDALLLDLFDFEADASNTEDIINF